ncbi:hypothetical protein F5B20DRAFT_348680 [Whalleya microplaca]|nr:hypothetical protein F5B20DRAFT_348680 [Whalleya microplaca]
MQFRSCLMAVLAAGSAVAHMNMKDPTPLAYKGNPNAKEPNIDYSITSPITKAEYPCKGNLKLLGTAEGASVKTYAPGGQYTMSVEGGASHNGGSCQLSLSYDKGTSFTVIKSYIGNCPTTSGGTFDFSIPSDAPEGDEVVFAWTWVNRTGNREFYMSCAVVSIKSGGAKREVTHFDAKRDTAFASRPAVFTANFGEKYCTKEGVDTVFPEPGPDVENTSTAPGPAVDCTTGEAIEGSGSDTGSGSGSSSSAGAGAAAPSSTSAAVQQPVTTSAAAATTATPQGGVFLTLPPSGSSSPTTLSTATIATSSADSGSGSGSGSGSSSAAAGGGASATSSAAPPSTTGGSGTGVQTGTCTNEGAWACSSDGSSFQRCASGAWSAAIPMAAGTKCTPGISANLSMRRRRDRVRRSGTGFGNWDY